MTSIFYAKQQLNAFVNAYDDIADIAYYFDKKNKSLAIFYAPFYSAKNDIDRFKKNLMVTLMSLSGKFLEIRVTELK